MWEELINEHFREGQEGNVKQSFVNGLKKAVGTQILYFAEISGRAGQTNRRGCIPLRRLKSCGPHYLDNVASKCQKKKKKNSRATIDSLFIPYCMQNQQRTIGQSPTAVWKRNRLLSRSPSPAWLCVYLSHVEPHTVCGYNVLHYRC